MIGKVSDRSQKRLGRRPLCTSQVWRRTRSDYGRPGGAGDLHLWESSAHVWS